MGNQLDEEIFNDFIKKLKENNILSDKNLVELEGFKDKSNVSSEDWDLLVDKECFPNKSGEDNE